MDLSETEFANRSSGTEKAFLFSFWYVPGHTSLIPGLLERLTLELKKRLPQKWTQYLHVVAAEKRLSEEGEGLYPSTDKRHHTRSCTRQL